MTNSRADALTAARRCADRIGQPGVVAVFAGRKPGKDGEGDEPCVVFGVEKKIPLEALSPGQVLPRSIADGDNAVATDVVEIGLIVGPRPIPLPPVGLASFDAGPRGKFRPIIGGVSVGHRDITAGTIGLFVIDGRGRRYLLSNNHVLANSNAAEIGDDILQPGPYDGGDITSIIGGLERFKKIEMMGPLNPVDAALAALDAGIGDDTPITPPVGSPPRACWFAKTFNAASAALGHNGRLTAYTAPQDAAQGVIRARSIEIAREWFGPLPVKPTGRTGFAAVGDVVHKVGRTTGVTTGRVIALSATVEVGFDAGNWARFGDQIIIQSDDGEFSAGGDSGSGIFNDDGDLIGLLFAGSEGTPDNPGITIANPIAAVFAALGIVAMW